MSKIDKASIYVNAQNLFKVLYYAQFDAPKRDRIALFNRMLDHCEAVISSFSLSYLTERKIENIEVMMAHFEALKVEIRFAMDSTIIRREGTQTELRDLMSRMQDGMDKWRSFIISARQD